MSRSLTPAEVQELLKAACDQQGGVSALAKILGISTSAVSQQLNGHSPIYGKVASHLGVAIERQTSITYRTNR